MKSLLLAILFFIHEPIQVSYRTLTYADFKGHGPEAGHIETGIDLHESYYNGKHYFSIDCYFIPEESYLNIRTEYSRRHEQGHLDISKIFSNDINYDLERFQGCDSLTAVVAHKFYDNMIHQWRDQEEEYDKETFHSIDTAMQAKWNKYFDYNLKQIK